MKLHSQHLYLDVTCGADNSKSVELLRTVNKFFHNDSVKSMSKTERERGEND